MKKQCKPPTSVRKRNGRRTESSRTGRRLEKRFKPYPLPQFCVSIETTNGVQEGAVVLLMLTTAAAQLENKLEDLVSLLKSQAEAGSIQFEDPESAGTGRSTPYSRTHSTSRSHRAMSPVDGAYISEVSTNVPGTDFRWQDLESMALEAIFTLSSAHL